jgi:hypothetical protein
MGCAASTGPLYRDEHDFATTAAYYDKDDDVKKDWVENEQLGEDETPLRGALDALWASDLPPTTMLHVRRIQTGNVAGLGEGKRVSCEEPE